MRCRSFKRCTRARARTSTRSIQRVESQTSNPKRAADADGAVTNGSAIDSRIDLEHAAERHEYRSHAGASERAYPKRADEADGAVTNESAIDSRIDLEHAAERHE